MDLRETISRAIAGVVLEADFEGDAESEWEKVAHVADAVIKRLPATPEPVAPTPSREPDRSRMYKVGDQWWPYPHGMTEEEWNRKIAALWSKLTICDDVYHRRSVIAAIVDFGYRQKEIAAVIIL